MKILRQIERLKKDTVPILQKFIHWFNQYLERTVGRQPFLVGSPCLMEPTPESRETHSYGHPKSHYFSVCNTEITKCVLGSRGVESWASDPRNLGTCHRGGHWSVAARGSENVGQSLTVDPQAGCALTPHVVWDPLPRGHLSHVGWTLHLPYHSYQGHPGQNDPFESTLFLVSNRQAPRPLSY